MATAADACSQEPGMNQPGQILSERAFYFLRSPCRMSLYEELQGEYTFKFGLTHQLDWLSHLGPQQCSLRGLHTTVFPEGTLDDHFRTDFTSPQQCVNRYCLSLDWHVHAASALVHSCNRSFVRTLTKTFCGWQIDQNQLFKNNVFMTATCSC